ncbi:MAG TPA: TonB-dependent receptor, partial [Candidatus Polarisedimenticolia bacterium]|nr:TonB-dependent receptor [Candidatus Polarisedimenticolia bacterium]
AEEEPEGPIERIEVRESGGPLDAALDSTAFATVIHADDFADRVTTLEELLRETAGVQVSSLGDAFATVSIRGSTAEQVVVYLDGVPLNRAIGGGVNLADLPLAQIESIEIYRSFTPASLPSASIGGAIVINTRGGPGVAGGTASATVGSYSSAEATFSFAGSKERSDFHVGLDASTSDGDFTFTDTDGSQSTTGDDLEARRSNNDFDRVHLSGRYDAAAGDRTRLRLSADLLSRRQGVPGVGNLQSEDARFETSRLLFRPEFETAGLLGGLLLIRGALDYTRVREQFEDSGGDLGLQQSTDNLISSLGQEFGATLVASAHQALSLLVAHREETADLEDRLDSRSDAGRASRDTMAFVLEDQIAVAGERVLINPSIRHERYDGTFEVDYVNGAIPDQGFASGDNTTGKIGLRFELNEFFTLKGNYGSFVRLPDFLELFGNRGAVIGNPLLDPEEGRTFDAGFITTHGDPGGSIRQLRFAMTCFQTRADNLIQFEPTGQFWVVARNTGRARIRGVELEVSLRFGSRFSGSINATHQEAVSAGGDIFDGRILVGRPRDEVSSRMELSLGRWSLFHAFTYVGPNYVDRLNTESTALTARYLHDLGAHVALSAVLSAGIEVKNVTDQETFDFARFPLPGRRFAGRLIWNF